LQNANRLSHKNYNEEQQAERPFMSGIVSGGNKSIEAAGLELYRKGGSAVKNFSFELFVISKKKDHSCLFCCHH
jgi:hypothetical protein